MGSTSFIRSGKWKNYKGIIGYYLYRLTGYRRIHERSSEDKTDYLKKEFQHLTLPTYHKLSYKSYRSFLISFITRPYTTLRCETEGLHALRHRVECRYPMTDIRLLEFLLSVPYPLFEPKGNDRWFFRKSLEMVLPREIFNRSDKTGAVLPYLRIKNEIFLKQLESITLDKDSVKIDLINIEKVKKQINKRDELKKEVEVTSLLSAIYLHSRVCTQ